MSFLLSESWNPFVQFVFVTGFVGLVALNWQMVNEINTKLPEDRQWNFWFMWWPGDSFRIYMQHRRLFPDSRVRLASNIIGAIWIPFGAIGIWRILRAIDAWAGLG